MTQPPPTTPKPPTGLTPRAEQLWRDVLADFELSPAQLQLLATACESLSTADRADEVIRVQGMTVVDRYGGTRQHPMLDVALRSRQAFARTMNVLKLDATVQHPTRLGRPAAGDTRRDPRLRQPVAEPRPPRERPRLV